MEMPEFKFAFADDGSRIAYQTLGSGPPVILVPEILGSLALQWDSDLYARVWEHFSHHVSLILYDKRGTGMSDQFKDKEDLEVLAGDIQALVMAEGFSRVSLSATGDGAMEAVAFAALYPELTERLALSNPSSGVGRVDSANLAEDDDLSDIRRTRDGFAEDVLGLWGADAQNFAERLIPSLAGDPTIIEWWTRYQRIGVSRSDAVDQIQRMWAMRLGDLPEQVTAPTLITHTTGNRVISIAHGRMLAERIAGATMVEIDADDHVVWFARYWRDIVDAQISFITDSEIEIPVQRTFAVVLFTDVVGSTRSALVEGDEQWKHRLDAHDRVVEQTVGKHSGTLVKSTGDGILATFESLSDALVAANLLVDRLSELGIPIRVGLHSGEIELRDGDVSGTIVNLAARVMDTAGEGQIVTTSAVRDGLLGSSFTFSDAGQHSLKGFDGQWQLYSLDREQP